MGRAEGDTQHNARMIRNVGCRFTRPNLQNVGAQTKKGEDNVFPEGKVYTDQSIKQGS